MASHRFGPYTLQPAIAAVHAEASSASATDWPQIVGLYDVLLRTDPSPVIELNRAAAVAMRDGPEAGLALIDAILVRGDWSITTWRTRHAAIFVAASPVLTTHYGVMSVLWSWRLRRRNGAFSAAESRS